MVRDKRSGESTLPHGRIISKITLILDILMIGVFLLIIAMVVTGGWNVRIFDATITMHRPENAGIGMLLILAVRWLIDRKKPVRDIPLIRHLIRMLVAVSKYTALRPRTTIAILISGYLVTMGTVVTMRHFAFHSHGLDLGIFGQLLWSAANGYGLHSSVLGRHFLGEHFSPILYIFVPGYRLWPHPAYLLLIQTLALALAAVPLYRIAASELRSTNWGVFFSFLYLCYQPMRNANLFDFHPVTFATPLLMLAFYFLHKRKDLAFLLVLCAALACKEVIAGIVFIFGVYILLVQKRRVFGGLLAASGIAAFFAIIYLVIPHFREEPYAFVWRYSYLGPDLPAILTTIVTRPLYVAHHVFTVEKLQYIWRVFGPLGLLSFLSPSQLLLAVPTLAQSLLSNFPFQYGINFWYTSPLTPFVFISAVFGAKRLLSRKSVTTSVISIARGRGTALPAILIVLTVVLFGVSPILRINYNWPTGYSRYVNENILSKISADASVSGQDPFVPHLTNRKQLYQFPVVKNADYVVLDSRANMHVSDDEYFRRAEQLMDEPYRIVLSNGSLLFLERCPGFEDRARHLPDGFLRRIEPVFGEND